MTMGEDRLEYGEKSSTETAIIKIIKIHFNSTISTKMQNLQLQTSKIST